MNLSKFVTIYKVLLLLQRRLNGGKERPHDNFFAGMLGGYLVFGERNAINEQVRLFTPFISYTPVLPPCGRAVRICLFDCWRHHFSTDRAVRLFSRACLIYTPRASSTR